MPAARAPSLVRPPHKSVRLAVDMVMSAQGVIVPGKQQPPRMWARVNPGSAAAAEVKARRESVRIGWKHRYRRRPALPLVCRYYLHRRWVVVVWLRGPRPATELQQEALAGGVEKSRWVHAAPTAYIGHQFSPSAPSRRGCTHTDHSIFDSFTRRIGEAMRHAAVTFEAAALGKGQQRPTRDGDQAGHSHAREATDPRRENADRLMRECPSPCD